LRKSARSSLHNLIRAPAATMMSVRPRCRQPQSYCTSFESTVDCVRDESKTIRTARILGEELGTAEADVSQQEDILKRLLVKQEAICAVCRLNFGDQWPELAKEIGWSSDEWHRSAKAVHVGCGRHGGGGLHH